MNRVAIIGGGITGLAAAHRLHELSPETEIELLEASSSWGGVLKTERLENFLVEHSADMFTTLDSSAVELCERIGFKEQLIGTNQTNQRAFIASGNQLVPVPKGLNLMTPSDLDAIRSSELLTDEGKKRFLDEEFVPPKEKAEQGALEDESLESFAVRRFGEEAYRKIIQPLVGGIYTADPTKLSLKATLPQYLQMEAQHGSVIAAAKKRNAVSREASGATSGARYNLFMAPQGGMATLVEALRARVAELGLLTQHEVTDLTAGPKNQWEVKFASGTSRVYDSIIVTVPADHAAIILQKSAPELSGLLKRIQYASSAIVIHGFDRNQIGHPLNGFGFVVPLTENRSILAGSFSSNKFAGRSPDDQVLTRTFIGGGCQPELLNHDDDVLSEMARNELGELLGIEGKPLVEKVVRWNHSMPQYHLGHLDLVDEIDSQVRSIAGLELAGKSYRGVGIPACIRSGENAAENVFSLSAK